MFVARRLKARNPLHGERTRYRVYVPAGYTPARRWPLVLFLHGSGERGTDGVAPTRTGLGPAIRARPEWFPLLAAFPQAPPGATWSGEQLAGALHVLAEVERAYNTDPERVYLVGVSMGGYGAWQLALEQPTRFAALVPVSAGVRALAKRLPAVKVGDPTVDACAEIARALRDVPTWIFHGADDPNVPVADARHMAAALRALGAPVRFTEFPHFGHDAWDPAFNSPDLWEWLLAQRRGARAARRPRRRASA